MDKSGLFGEILEKGQGAVSDTTKAVKSQLTGFGKAAKNQVAPDQNNPQDPSDNQDLDKTKELDQEKHSRDMVKHIYGVEDLENKDKNINQEPKKETSSVKIEDEKKIQELKQRLHQEYYQKLTNPPKQEEERPAEKLEREKKQEMQELEQKETKKPPPLAVKRAQTAVEVNRGASG